MGRLEDKMDRVSGIAGRLTNHIESRADRVLEREPQLIARSESYFSAKEAILDDAERALDKAERAMALLANHPLEASGASPAVETTPKQTF